MADTERNVASDNCCQTKPGGFSGGTLNRPGVQRLLEDVREGLVDVIVVYKIDRLSRSLADYSGPRFQDSGLSCTLS